MGPEEALEGFAEVPQAAIKKLEKNVEALKIARPPSDVHDRHRDGSYVPMILPSREHARRIQCLLLVALPCQSHTLVWGDFIHDTRLLSNTLHVSWAGKTVVYWQYLEKKQKHHIM